MAGISQSVRALIDRNARSGVEQGEYEREYQGMTERFAELEKRLKGIEAECDRRRIQRSAMTGFLKALKTTQAPIADFTPQLWNALVEKATVNADGSMVFTFRNGVDDQAKGIEANDLAKFRNDSAKIHFAKSYRHNLAKCSGGVK